MNVTPPGIDPEQWQRELRELAMTLSESCRAVDPTSTDYALQHAGDPDLVTLDKPATAAVPLWTPPQPTTETDPYADWPDPEGL